MNWYGKGNSVDQKRYARRLCLSRSATESLLALLRLRFTVSLQMKSLKNSARTARDNFRTALGKSLEQRPIKTPDGDIYVSFWNSDDNWSLQTEEEINSIQSEDLTDEPDIGMTM